MNIEDRIAELKLEIDNIYLMWSKEVVEFSKDESLVQNSQKSQKTLEVIAKKYAPMLVEREDKLHELARKRDQGI